MGLKKINPSSVCASLDDNITNVHVCEGAWVGVYTVIPLKRYVGFDRLKYRNSVLR